MEIERSVLLDYLIKVDSRPLKLTSIHHHDVIFSRLLKYPLGSDRYAQYRIEVRIAIEELDPNLEVSELALETALPLIQDIKFIRYLQGRSKFGRHCCD